MRILMKMLVPAAISLLSGCVIAPIGPPRAYVRVPRVAIVAPAPVVIVRPGYFYRYRW